jgi:hypothetical protein
VRNDFGCRIGQQRGFGDDERLETVLANMAAAISVPSISERTKKQHITKGGLDANRKHVYAWQCRSGGSDTLAVHEYACPQRKRAQTTIALPW